MRFGLLVLLPLLLSAAYSLPAQPSQRHWSIVLHGGAGVIDRSAMDAKTDVAYRASLKQALLLAAAVLDKGGSSLDAIAAAIGFLEDDPLFNAGRGAVFTAAGKNELDAAIMDGATLRAGAVAGVTRTRHPILLARTVMERSPHVMLIGTPLAGTYQAIEEGRPAPSAPSCGCAASPIRSTLRDRIGGCTQVWHRRLGCT
jgi:beta-aspartyl-peptidase (threonine type)